MCGIIGYHGKKPATTIVVEGLKKLEYRGYDSWGIAISNDSLFLKKQVGKISDAVIPQVKETDNIKMGIGHTRWATHGKVTEENAHPHISSNNKIAIVHNGIIENYEDLKKSIKTSFVSETDSEVIAHLIEANMKNNDFFTATIKTANMLKGRYAFVAVNQDTREMAGVKKGSPLVIGVNEVNNINKEYFIASDISAFLDHTKDVIFLEDGEAFHLNGTISYYSMNENKKIKKPTEVITWDFEKAEKGNFTHYMLKEIFEQKETILRAANQDKDKLTYIGEIIKNSKKIFLVGCGTAGKVAMIGRYLFSQIISRNAPSIIGSEFKNYQDYIDKDCVVIAISQSGETADTLEALEVAKQKNATIISIVNVPGSTMTRVSDHVLMSNAGPEIAVASTKATTAQITVLIMLAYAVLGKISQGRKHMEDVQKKVATLLNKNMMLKAQEIAYKLKDEESMYVIGRGLSYPLALEAAIKLQEVAYIHADGFAGGELKHGPIALIDKNTKIIVIAPKDETFDDTVSNVLEIKSRGGHIIAISPQENSAWDEHIQVPVDGFASPILHLIPVQLIAYYLSVIRGNDPDKPRNLAKSVTVK